MWILTDIVRGFPDVPVATLSLARLLFAVAVLWKIGWEFRWGSLHYFDKGTLTRYRYERIKRHAKLELSPAAYKVFHITRAVAAVAFLAGVGVQLAALTLCLWFAFEFTFDRKFHTQFMCLMALMFAFSQNYGDCLGYRSLLSPGGWNSPQYCGSQVHSWSVPVILGVLLMVQMYWSSVRFKVVSPQFLSGDVLQKTSEHYALIRHEMPFPEFSWPAIWYRFMATAEPDVVRRRWRPLALATLALEVCVPVLLFVPATFVAGVVLGVLMHLGFTTLFPKRLLPYALACFAGFVLFADPDTAVGWLGSR